MGVGVGLGAGIGVRVGEGLDVVNFGSVPVPRTQASGAVHGLLAEMLLPSALQELVAACTMARRRAFSPVSKEVVP